jgi:hypothetical protein
MQLINDAPLLLGQVFLERQGRHRWLAFNLHQMWAERLAPQGYDRAFRHRLLHQPLAAAGAL